MKMQIRTLIIYLLILGGLVALGTVLAPKAMATNTCESVDTLSACQSIDVKALGFKIPSLGDILTFVIRAFFVIAGLAALLYMLIGAFSWVTSGGDSDAVSAARNKIQAAVVGMLIIVAVLALVWTMEQVIFQRRICLGLSCPVTMPGLIESTTGTQYCCACVSADGARKTAMNAYDEKCMSNGDVLPL